MSVEALMTLEKHLHMRGADQAPAARVSQVKGNISTCVEQISILSLHLFPAKKHLHMRGADPVKADMRGPRGETSPHAWSRWWCGHRWTVIGRNISTCVEQMADAHHQRLRRQKHLHMRGADSALKSIIFSSLETSPHAWSRFLSGRLGLTLGRNISTCVEQMLQSCPSSSGCRKHLHMRGADGAELPRRP